MIDIVDYNENWPKVFLKEKVLIQKALGSLCLEIHHFGSTAVKGLLAKPKIDILIVVESFSSMDIAALEKIGFENRGEVIPTGRYFSKKTPRVHLHFFEKGNPLIKQNLKFRNYLRLHDEDRIAYANLKKELALLHSDGMEYCLAKTEFINNILKKYDT
jgi:GrpB-like predicted nucleotidyltransferase (UPF0157 family)